MAEGDIFWRSPDPSADRAAGYEGPPGSPPAPPEWRPIQRESAAPRELPKLDHKAIDAAEREAARLTYAIGLAAALTLIVLACFLIF
jgi:hypothetical protein